LIESKLFNNLKFKLVLSGAMISLALCAGVFYLQHLIFTNSANLYTRTVRNQALYGEFTQVKHSLTQSLLTFTGVHAIFHDSNQSFEYGEESFFKIKLFSYFDSGHNVKMATYVFYYKGLYGVFFAVLMNLFSFIILFIFYKKSKSSILLELDLQRRAESVNTLKWISKQVSHDLASPLSAINNLIYAAKFDSEQLDLFKAITKRISDISRDLLRQGEDFSSEETSNVSELATIFIPKLLNEKIIEFSNDVKIEYEIINKSSSLIALNSIEVLRVLSNLINNAYEASSEKKMITVKIFEDEKYFNLSVKDAGKGIPPDVLKKLNIESFNYGKKGSGLGIYGARKILEKVGGKIVIKSDLNIGTEVLVSIPFMIN